MPAGEKKKKVIFFIPTLAQGGAERVISELSSHVPNHVELVLVLFEKKVSYPFRGRIEYLNISLSRNIFLRIFRFGARWQQFKKLLAKESPDLVVSFGYSANLINILANKKAVIRVDMFLTQGRRGIFGAITKKIAKIMFKRATLILAVCRAIREDLIENFDVPADRIRVTHNPVDEERIGKLALQPIPREFETIFQKPVIVAMGRLTKQKGQWHLLKAFQYAASRIPEAQLVILGKGMLQEKLKTYAEGLGLKRQVHFLGWQENPYAFLSRAKVFALSSLWEGLPVVMLEAMACGLPVVSVDCKSGPREILALKNQEFGILTPVCSGTWNIKEQPSQEEQLLGEALAKVLEDKEYASALHEKSLARAHDFSTENILQEYEFLWEK